MGLNPSYSAAFVIFDAPSLLSPETGEMQEGDFTIFFAAFVVSLFAVKLSAAIY